MILASMHGRAILGIALLAAGTNGQSDPALTPLDHKAMAELTARHETKHVLFHYRPRDLP